MAAFQFTDPKTGIKYSGPDASARWAAYLSGKPFAEKGLPAGMNTLGPPPVGTYDPAIDYNASAAGRGFENTKDDASTAFTQGQEDFGLNLGDLTRGRDRNEADIVTGRGRLDEDYSLDKTERMRQYGILGNQQGERAAQQGITSAGLLAKSAGVRSANQGREQAATDLQYNRGITDLQTSRDRNEQDFTSGKTRLDLGNARAFGGFQGHTILNPLTGQPQVGSLLTSLTRAGTENNSFQTFSAGQRSSQAAANGYVPPGMIPPAPGSRAQGANDFRRRLRIS